MKSADYKALTRALSGVEYELREQREAVATCERLARSRDEITQGAIRAHRVETDRQLVEVSALRRHVGDIFALVRTARTEPQKSDAVTSPFSGSRWERAGWKPPTPHQVLAILFIVTEALRESEVFPTGSNGARIVGLLLTVFALLGINEAKNYQSPQIMNKLRAVDERALEDIHNEGARR